MECWYPIVHGDKGLIQEPLFKDLADKYGKTAVQIMLRWHIQEGNIIFPKTTNPLHMQEDFDIFDFCLNEQEMRKIRALDCGKRFLPCLWKNRNVCWGALFRLIENGWDSFSTGKGGCYFFY